MKIEREGQATIVIGKRVTIGAAVTSTASVFASLFPEYASAILAASVAVTFIIQVIVANRYGITQ
jgi:hypothetical protein